VIAFFLLWLGCSEPPVEEPVVRSVRVVTFGDAEAGGERQFSGRAKPANEASVSFKVSGRIVSLPVKVGSEVSRGDILAKVDSSDYQLKLQQAQASLAQARANAVAAKSAASRVEKLYINNNASTAEVESARAEAAASGAQVAAASRERDLARTQLNDATLTAPLTGKILEVLKNESEMANVGEAIVRMAGEGGLEVEFGVPSRDIGRVRQDMEIRAAFPALQETYEGTITEVGADASSGAFPVTAALHLTDDAVRAGMTANVSLDLPRGQATPTLPAIAVGQDKGGNFVWVVAPQSDGMASVSRRGVEVGDLAGAGLTIEEGLDVGELVATAGVSKLTEGQIVRLPEGEL